MDLLHWKYISREYEIGVSSIVLSKRFISFASAESFDVNSLEISSIRREMHSPHKWRTTGCIETVV